MKLFNYTSLIILFLIIKVNSTFAADLDITTDTDLSTGGTYDNLNITDILIGYNAGTDDINDFISLNFCTHSISPLLSSKLLVKYDQSFVILISL